MTGRTRDKQLNLALQGGGAHGAYTWGVLDALLARDDISFTAISGTSAGAMNAVAMADGWVKDGRAGARESLSRFWTGVADKARYAPTNAEWLRLFDPFDLTGNMTQQWLATWLRNTSPYDVNPLNINPLRDVIEDLIDFERVRACEAFELFVAATHVETGRTQIFRRDVLDVDHVLASACLPFLFQAVEIEGHHFWDGGFVGNPPLFPFFYETDCEDILVVQINPLHRKGVPRRIEDIIDRMTEISFNSSLLREYRAIAFVQRLVEEGHLSHDSYKNIRLHQIDGGAALMDLSASSRLIAGEKSFEELFRRGRESAADWLDANARHINRKSTLDVRSIIKNDPYSIHDE